MFRLLRPGLPIGLFAIAGLILAMLAVAPSSHPRAGVISRRNSHLAFGRPGGRMGGTMMNMMPMVAPLFIQNSQFTSTLVMVNGSNLITFADVILTGLDGREITRQQVQFTPHGQRRLDISGLLAAASSGATTGKITVMQSPDLRGSSILAQLVLTYSGSAEPNYIDEEVAMPSPSGSQTLRAVADVSDGSPLLAITSLSESGQHVTIECLGSDGADFSKGVDLLAGETLLTEACAGRTTHGADFQTVAGSASQGPRQAVGIALTSDATPGSFAAFGLAPHRRENDMSFSAITFSDPKKILSSTTVFTGVPVGSAALLPEGQYTPQLALANFSAKDLQVRIKYAQTSGSAPAVQDLGSIIVAARSSKAVTLDNLQGDPGLQNSFLISSDGAPGEVMAKLISTSDSRLRQVESLGKDESDPFNGGSHPWSIEQGTESTLLLFNHSSKPQYFNVFISTGGAPWTESYQLSPMQTQAISIRSLIEGQIKDNSGKTLPKGILSGQIGWFTPEPGNGKGRILQSDRALAMARSFSCSGNWVLCKDQSADFLPDVTIFRVGDNVHFGHVFAVICAANPEGPRDCTGDYSYETDVGFTVAWRSLNTNIASTSSSGWDAQVTGTGVGTAFVDAFITGGGCTQDGGGDAIVVPRIDSISPSRGLIGATTSSVTITGQGLGGGTVNAGTGITVTVTSSNNTTIVANFAIASNAPSGNHSVTVTNSGQQSNAATFFVQVPTSLSIVAGTDSTTSESTCTFTDSNGNTLTGCGVTRSFTYQVNDQDSPPQPIRAAGLQIWDSFSTPSPNNLNVTGFTTTCSPANTGPCGPSTNSAGQFLELSLSVCATVCRVNNACTTGGPSTTNQTWHVGSFTIIQNISYYCDRATVNGQ